MFFIQVAAYLRESSLPLIIIPAILVVYILNAVQWVYHSGLRDLPGPSLAPYSQLWRIFSLTMKGKAPLEYRKLHENYGKIVRTGPDTVSISDPAMIPIIYGFNSTYVKSSFYDVFTMIYKNKTTYNVFSTQNPHHHKYLRSRAANKYSTTSLRDLEPQVDECSDLFVAKMHKLYNEDPKGSVDLGAWLQYYAFDVVGAMTFQQTFGFMEQEKDVDDMIGGIEVGLHYIGLVGNVKGLHNWLFGSKLVSAAMACIPGAKDGNPIPKFIKICQDAINAYDENDAGNSSKESRTDFLSWFRKEAQKSKEHMSDDDLMFFLLVNLLAGSDTTAISLRAIVYYIIKSPRAYKKLQQEIDDMDNASLLSTKVSLEESNKMPYLQATMKEAMRIHPAVAYPLERLVPKGGAELCGVHLPGGTRVGINASVVHMNKEVFGEDVDEFRPERWLDADVEQLKIMEKSFLAFGNGTRSCIGKNISLMEMGKLIPEIFRNFDVEWTSPNEEWDVSTFWFAKQTGIQVRCTPRARGSVK